MITSNLRANDGRSPQNALLIPGPLRESAMSREILVVDDDDSIRRSLARLLACHAYSTLTAENGTEALALAVERRPAIILMDVEMPMMNGFDAARAIKAHATLADVQIIALSAAPIPKNEFTSLFAHILQKPCAGDAVIATVEAAIFQYNFRKVPM